MTTNIYKFEGGRLLVRESKALESDYHSGGVPFRIGQIRQIEEVISVDSDYSQYGLITDLKDVRVSGNELFVVMRRGDIGAIASGTWTIASGSAALGLVSGITSGLGWRDQLRSGYGNISGVVTLIANVIGY